MTRVVALPLLVVALLGSCSVTGGDSASGTAAPRSPACAALAARLPPSVLDEPRAGAASDDATVLAAWGDPSIEVRCDVPAPAPSDDACLAVNGVDWVLKTDPDVDGPVVFVTFGRTPYVEVTVPSAYGRQDATAALVDLTTAVAPLPTTAGCP